MNDNNEMLSELEEARDVIKTIYDYLPELELLIEKYCEMEHISEIVTRYVNVWSNRGDN